MEAQPKKLLDQACTELCRSVRDAIRLKHYSIRTEVAYVDWIRRFILFHDKRHPRDMAGPEACPELCPEFIEGPVEGSQPSSPTWPSKNTSPPPLRIPALSLSK